MRCQAHNHGFTWLKTLSHLLRYTRRPATKRKNKKQAKKTNYSSTNASGPKVRLVLSTSMECQTFQAAENTVFYHVWQAGRRGPCCQKEKATKWSPFANPPFCPAGAPSIQPQNTTLWPWYDSLISVFSCPKVSQNLELNWLSKSSLNLPFAGFGPVMRTFCFGAGWMTKWTPNEAYDSLLESLDPKLEGGHACRKLPLLDRTP